MSSPPGAVRVAPGAGQGASSSVAPPFWHRHWIAQIGTRLGLGYRIRARASRETLVRVGETKQGRDVSGAPRACYGSNSSKRSEDTALHVVAHHSRDRLGNDLPKSRRSDAWRAAARSRLFPRNPTRRSTEVKGAATESFHASALDPSIRAGCADEALAGSSRA